MTETGVSVCVCVYSFIVIFAQNKQISSYQEVKNIGFRYIEVVQVGGKLHTPHSPHTAHTAHTTHSTHHTHSTHCTHHTTPLPLHILHTSHTAHTTPTTHTTLKTPYLLHSNIATLPPPPPQDPVGKEGLTFYFRMNTVTCKQLPSMNGNDDILHSSVASCL